MPTTDPPADSQRLRTAVDEWLQRVETSGLGPLLDHAPTTRLEHAAGRYHALTTRPVFVRTLLTHPAFEFAIIPLLEAVHSCQHSRSARPGEICAPPVVWEFDRLEVNDKVRTWARGHCLDYDWFVDLVAFRLTRSDRGGEWWPGAFLEEEDRRRQADPVGAIRAMNHGLADAVSQQEPPDDERLLSISLAGDSLFTPPAADPTTETLQEFLRRAETHFRARSSFLAMLGYTPVKGKSASGRTALEDHVLWLARYQVLKQSPSDISRLPPRAERQSVDEGIKRLAAVLGITPR
jgi:hypothetical protein